MMFLAIVYLVSVAYMMPSPIAAESCSSASYVYGENDAIDQILTCSLSKTLDIDLTPQGDYIKNTPKSLVDQGLSNKTVIIAAKLGGLWSARRADIVNTGWRCSTNGTEIDIIIEVTGLSLDVVEKVDFPIQRSSKKADQKPCKNFDLPLWLCRHSKPIYRTTKTWVNRAFYNLKLNQPEGNNKPSIVSLELLFTCPETFRQKITYSPSAMYVLKKQVDLIESGKDKDDGKSKRKRRVRHLDVPSKDTSTSKSSIVHPVYYVSTQDGNSPATPPYHSFVNLIVKQSTDLLRSSLSNCIQILDSDLSLSAGHNSFSNQKFNNQLKETNKISDKEKLVEEIEQVGDCSDGMWLKNRIVIAIDASKLEDQIQGSGSNISNQGKRSDVMLNYPVDPNQLLNPYGYYHENADLVVF